MKIEQLVVQYLYKHKQVSIQDIGQFSIGTNVIIPTEGDKDYSLPEGAIHFEFDKNAPADEGLIDFIKEQSGKIRSLAASDLESYSILTRQFLNIGKPLYIEGLGTLQKTQYGTFNFTQGTHISTLKSEGGPIVIKEKIKEDISFASEAKKTSSVKGWMIAILSIFILSAAAAVYYYFTKEKDEKVTEAVQEPSDNDSTNLSTTNVPAIPDSIKQKDSIVSTTKLPSPDGSTFKIVIKEYPTKVAAEKAASKLKSWGHTVLLETKDSSTYTVAMPFTTALSDTLRAKDSLKKFFGGKPYIKL
ncbi:MAG TPA: hypothetical protein PKU77_09070 [Ferruginibacter sp.]|nr:hypothetical protein [Ferruginibacter sp.]